MSRDVKKIIEIIARLPSGHVAEIGVEQGYTFVELVRATKSGYRAFAFDSFVGMAPPGKMDGHHYPAGRFNVGGVDGFQQKMRLYYGVASEEYEARSGFVPDCFHEVDEKFVFVRIDLDHHDPTLIAATWAVEHLVPGGVLNFDDFFFGKKTDASSAIAKFILRTDGTWIAATVDFRVHNIYLTKKRVRKR